MCREERSIASSRLIKKIEQFQQDTQNKKDEQAVWIENIACFAKAAGVYADRVNNAKEVTEFDCVVLEGYAKRIKEAVEVLRVINARKEG